MNETVTAEKVKLPARTWALGFFVLYLRSTAALFLPAIFAVMFFSNGHTAAGVVVSAFGLATAAYQMGEAVGRATVAAEVIESLDELLVLETQFQAKPGAVWPEYGDWPVTKEGEIMARLRAKVESPT